MFSVLLICGVVVVVYLLLWVKFVKIPKCKSTAKLHGRTVIVTGKCFCLFSSNRLSCFRFISICCFYATPANLYASRKLCCTTWRVNCYPTLRTCIRHHLAFRGKHGYRQSHSVGSCEERSSGDFSMQEWKQSPGCCHRHPEGETKD